MMIEKRKFHHLPPLPGGGDQYLQTVDNILEAFVNQKLDHRSTLVNWLIRTYKVTKSSAVAYLQCLAKLDLVSLKRSGSITLTDTGQNYRVANQQQRCEIIAGILFARAAGCLEILQVFAANEEPLHLRIVIERLAKRTPYWQSRSPIEHRIHWLLSLGCLEQVGAREYQIAEFGREQLVIHTRGASLSRKLSLHTLVQELDASSTDTQHPIRFERALANAFRFLGYEVTEIGTSGDTDLIVKALAGSGSYTAIIDAKTRADGRLREFSAYTLQEHKQLHHVDHIVVVASDFAEGKVLRQAMEVGITLITTKAMEDWLDLHTTTPLSITTYHDIFQINGIIRRLPETVLKAAQSKEELKGLLLQLVELMHDTILHGLAQPLPSQQWFTMLVTKLRSVRYSGEQVEEALALLANPLVAAVEYNNNGYMLTMNQASLALIFHGFSKQFDFQSEA